MRSSASAYVLTHIHIYTLMRIYIYVSSRRVHIDTRIHVDVHGQAFISFGSMSVLAVEATALQHFGIVNKGIRVLGTSLVVMRNR